MLSMLRGGSRTAATSKMVCFVIIVNGWKPITVITKRSFLDIAAALDPPLMLMIKSRLEDRNILCTLTHYVPVLPSYRNQSIDLTGFYMRTTLALNGLRGSAVEFPEGAIRDAL